MLVVLTQNVPGLGDLGDEIKVKPGYGRNFLIPQGLAFASNTTQSKEIAHKKRLLDAQRKAAIEKANELANSLKAQTFEITEKCGESGRLFGSVTNRDVEAVLSKLGYSISKKDIVITNPIKNVGSHSVVIRIHSQVKAEITLKVKGDVEVTEKEVPTEEPVIDEEAVLEQEIAEMTESDS